MAISDTKPLTPLSVKENSLVVKKFGDVYNPDFFNHDYIREKTPFSFSTDWNTVREIIRCLDLFINENRIQCIFDDDDDDFILSIGKDDKEIHVCCEILTYTEASENSENGENVKYWVHTKRYFGEGFTFLSFLHQLKNRFPVFSPLLDKKEN